MSALPSNAASFMIGNVSLQKTLHQATALEEKIPNTLTEKKTTCKGYFEKKVYILPTVIVEQHVYVDRPPNSFIVEDKKTSMRYKKLLSGTTKPFTVMYVKSHVVIINENSIANYHVHQQSYTRADEKLCD